MINGYTEADAIFFDGDYLPTIKPTNDLKIRFGFGIDTQGLSPSGYIFGARNTNSATSQGQLNFEFYTGQNTNYIGYNNGRSSFTGFGDYTSAYSFYGDGEKFQVINEYGELKSVNMTNTYFEGTQVMYFGALNNGGSPVVTRGLHITAIVFGETINGSDPELIYVPCVENESGNCGYLKLERNNQPVFIQCGSITQLKKITVTNTSGGEGYVKTLRNTLEKEIYRSGRFPITLTAIAQKGYAFSYWECSNGDKYYDKDWWITGGAHEPRTYTAHFEKIVDTEYKMGFRVITIDYATGSNSSRTTVSHAFVKSAKIKIDCMDKTTSTIEVEDVPSTFQVNVPLFLYSPKGEIVYSGIIKNIENNTLTCREPLSIYDEEHLFNVNTNSGGIDLTKRPVSYAFWRYMYYAHDITDKDSIYNIDADVFRNRLYLSTDVNYYTYYVCLYGDNILEKTTPLKDTIEIRNIEDYLLELSNNYNIYAELDFLGDADEYYGSHFIIYNTTQCDIIDISNNVETITNVNISSQDAEYTILIIFNKNATAFRGTFAIDNDGQIKQITNADRDDNSYIAYNKYKSKIVLTDDTDITPIVDETISSGLYSHEITFDLSLVDSFYSLESFKMGQKVMFYYNNKLYKSILTAMEYNIKSNADDVESVRITLGKVRQTLTSKIILNNRKK